MDTLLRIENLSVRYGVRPALTDLSMEIDRGTAVAVLGPNGAGKTTLARALSGLVPVSAGQVSFGGRQIQSVRASRIARLGIAMVPEGRRVFTQLSVLDNLRVGGYSLPKRVVDEEAERVMAVFPILAERRHQKGGAISGGQQQMLAIARALMSRPQLLVLDEPTMGLAPIVVHQLGQALRDLIASRDITVLLIDQRWSLVEEVAETIYLLRNGQARPPMAVQDVSPETINAAYFASGVDEHQ